MSTLENLSTNLISGKAEETKIFTKQALDEGVTPKDVLNNGLLVGMSEVGRRFKNNEFYVPEVLIAARAMKGAMAILKPLLAETGVEPVAKISIGTIKGDLHDIGKNLVGMMLEGGGFEVIDLGVDVTPDKFIASVKEQGAQVIGMSALLTTTMINMKDTVKALEDADLRNSVKIVIGGAPVTDSYATEIGADGYAPDAASAVDVIKSLL
ncbi:corrinoid protein [candidate division KSB1 bacterium]|nr:corrinoid protein [candidate division KSB1 bacterium]MBL7095179.1 corrinoid protein [candidate division KSB1 bacterium]